MPQAVMPAQAGIQYTAASREFTDASEYWIIRLRG
jgi:hypothetical protein